jgi:ribose/xylose/arabinose/galactoside ABC-type transport system permease subunit
MTRKPQHHRPITQASAPQAASGRGGSAGCSRNTWSFGCAWLYFVALAPFTPGFASLDNLRTILAYVLPILVVSTGLTLVLIIGGIDLSVTSMIALASVVGGKIMSG